MWGEARGKTVEGEKCFVMDDRGRFEVGLGEKRFERVKISVDIINDAAYN